VSTDLSRDWRDAREPAEVLHLDHAASSRQSTAVRDAVAGHVRLEGAVGGYVAEDAAEPGLERAREALRLLVGLENADVAFVDSASSALTALLMFWPVPSGSVVACLPGEYGPNRSVFARFGLVVRELPVDRIGRIDLELLPRWLAADSQRPALVHLTQVGSHRGVLQPAPATVEICRNAGVTVFIDAAQSLGQVDSRAGADAVYGASRKWLSGPRGVGMLATRPDRRVAEQMGTREGHIAGQVGLASALDEYLTRGPARTQELLAAVGRLTRETVDGAAGWAVVEPMNEPTAITTLAPPPGVDPLLVRMRLIERHRMVTSAFGTARAPGEMTGPLLRVSPHLDVLSEELEAFRTALIEVTER
jgi:hercynylcysteine S-oxide lyase